MKKLDKLIIKSFIGPFLLTFVVAVFILLLVYMMKYFDDFIGKNLGLGVFAELMGYFSINQIPMALPLAVLVSSLMTYGKLGEHFELTAIKGAGISLLRVILPTFVFTLFLAFGAFQLSDHVVPVANLKAFSLLYDIKQTKPSMDLREGQFYSGIPKYSIKIDKKYKDEISMSKVVIYDHTANNGNVKVIIADSCRMYSFMGDRYLKMDLFDGNYYIDEPNKKKKGKSKDDINDFVRTKFKNMDLVFSLASFDLNSTDKNLFADNRYMKGIASLTNSIDSMNRSMVDQKYKVYGSVASSFKYNFSGYLAPPTTLEILKAQNDSIKELKKLSLADTIRSEDESLPVEQLKEGETPMYTQKPTLEQDAKVVAKRELSRPEMARAKNSNAVKPVRKLELKDSLLSKIETDQNRKQPNKAPIKRPAKTKRNAKKRAEALLSQEATDSRMEKKKLRKQEIDTLLITNDSLRLLVASRVDSVFRRAGMKEQVFLKAVGNARGVKSNLNNAMLRIKSLKRSLDSHIVEKYKKYAQAFSCIVMFLIGAPLGSIIKRGGLGVPVIISIFFFIVFYVLTSVGDKWAKSGAVDGFYAAWMANFVLLPIGLFFLNQARKDVKIFDADFYNVWFDKVRTWWETRKENKKAAVGSH